MFDAKKWLQGLEAVLERLDALAADCDDEALEELSAEFEDALFMLSEIDWKGDWREELEDSLDELRDLCRDCAAVPGAGAIADEMARLIDAAGEA